MLSSIRQLVVTRPVGQAENLINKLSVIDQFDIIHLPLMVIQPIEFEWKGHNNSIDEFDAAVFISTNAAKYFYNKAQLNKTALFSVGDNTAALLKQFSQQKVIFPEVMSTEGFLQLPQLKSVTGQHWLIVKGKDGRAELHQELIKRGAKVTLLDVYQRQAPSQEIQEKIIFMLDTDSLWIITSAKALDNLKEIAEKNRKSCKDIKIIISSDRLANVANDKGFKIIAQSRGASEQQLVECIQKLK